MLSAGSDAPCTDPDPVLWMQRACNHDVPGESLTVAEALRMCTYNGAWATFDEDERGSLEMGKVADMAVLSADPFALGPERLGELRVEGLILGGEPYRPQGGTWLGAVARGLVSRAKA